MCQGVKIWYQPDTLQSIGTLHFSEALDTSHNPKIHPISVYLFVNLTQQFKVKRLFFFYNACITIEISAFTLRHSTSLFHSLRTETIRDKYNGMYCLPVHHFLLFDSQNKIRLIHANNRTFVLRTILITLYILYSLVYEFDLWFIQLILYLIRSTFVV